ncbi:MAG: hypothetical protein A3J48_00250 [Candidatus Doudnabacteria bacterium RIFCSPHIGHO2_02_FULL_46_11]|uniref:Uncharacterized protein n=1 Tax=Candidatus Doudnabacteria bacterium RIFCSPHIGHO2_02_FULL_46_11 TaxID=1817832 RepID=A0A1F5P6Z3_9BACT|nr:MAG: hypothetical protein A3J48_00250 [Candidatus Doudnabacteria bacterium RIFCSPHIGHO2_02_FULL_46_11]
MTHLDSIFIKEQKKKLLQEKKRLEAELETIADPKNKKIGDYETRFPNMGDDEDSNAAEVQLFEQNLAIERDLEAILRKINISLENIEKGKYGRCEQGDQIDEARLKVIPWATTCVKH